MTFDSLAVTTRGCGVLLEVLCGQLRRHRHTDARVKEMDFSLSVSSGG